MTVAPEPPDESRPPLWVWLFPMALLVLAIVSVPIMVLEPQGLPRYRSLEAELREIERDNDGLSHEVRRLDAEVRQLREDPAAMERIARDELGMVREGELVFQFPE
ncbi:MAG: septum formation initiator family protein [Sandaracinus sp.]